MRLHQNTIDQVRDRAQILDQFSQENLKKVGYEFASKCPWHDDRRPSLSISPQKNFAYCHVCARGVDAIGWVQDRQGLSFSEAVMNLAGQYNIEVQAADEEDAKKFEEERLERASLFRQREQQQEQFSERIWDSPGLEYLLGRELTAETIEEWGIGFNGNRVMFPLCDPQGRTVGFTGRVLDDSKPKYKNSQNDAIYQKANLVFGLHKARERIMATSQVVITEGQFDVVRLWQEDVRNVIAVSGSSLTRGMIENLVRTTRVTQVVLCFDGDLGGQKAAERAINELQEFALRGELDLRILVMPDTLDPADCAEVFPFLLEEAVSWVEYMFERAVEKIDLTDPYAITTAERGVKRILQILPKGGLREWVQRRAKEVLKAIPDVKPAKVQTQKQIDRCSWAERRAIRLYLMDQGCRPALAEISYTDPRMQQAWKIIEVLEGMGQDRMLRMAFAAVIQKLERDLSDELSSLCNPIKEVARVIEANPVNELEGAMAVLLSECCSSSNPDQDR
ncbi:DNA primase catalytic core/ N-terminal domain protein [Synechococcus sp. SYN20]|uniref:DNA primase n=1 Tax=Synechococcus sp. SYN20 TaxID=1050714 RepID=UPI00164571A3|nr:CHC2 zinc finger domain-containing protein [Synechococcus sp. SYN20]QNJ25886.1 DNA primase catalytic core/ N-terminal domain protein [Synechococcus sp. SYN20]